jgi:hypothetical protein
MGQRLLSYTLAAQALTPSLFVFVFLGVVGVTTVLYLYVHIIS